MSIPSSTPATSLPPIPAPRAPAPARGARLGREPSIGELLGELSQDVTQLMRQEIQLARTEMHEKVARITTDLVALAAGGVVVSLGGLALTAALVLLLIDPVGLRPWVAALSVAAVLGLVGLLMLRRGLTDLRRTDPAPRRTLETLKEDVQWMKEHRP
jgi:uncharacterized membrane protein YqjE